MISYLLIWELSLEGSSFILGKEEGKKGMGFNIIHFKREENIYYWEILSLKISFSNWQILSMLFIFILNEVSDMLLVCFPWDI